MTANNDHFNKGCENTDHKISISSLNCSKRNTIQIIKLINRLSCRMENKYFCTINTYELFFKVHKMQEETVVLFPFPILTVG